MRSTCWPRRTGLWGWSAWCASDGWAGGLLTPTNAPFWAAVAFLGFVEVSAVIFNLLPLPGIDGFGALSPWLPIDIRVQVARFGSGGLWLLWLLVFWGGGAGLCHVIYQLADVLRIPIGLVSAGRGH